MHYLATVSVRFKKSVLEPQGKAIELSLKETGHSGLGMIRVGKLIEIDVESNSIESARKTVEKVSEELLYNPVMEICDINIAEKK